MTVSDILNELQKRGIDIEMAGQNIQLHGFKNDFDESLVESIRTHKAEIIATLSADVGTDIKSRPNWCLECQHVRYETDDAGSKALWCGLADQAVLDLQKCVKGYWVKSEKGWPVTVH